MQIVKPKNIMTTRLALCEQGIGWTGAKYKGEVVFICESSPAGVELDWVKSIEAIQESFNGELELMLKDRLSKYNVVELQ